MLNFNDYINMSPEYIAPAPKLNFDPATLQAIMEAANDADSPSEETNDFASYFCTVDGKEVQIFKNDSIEVRRSHFVEVNEVRRELISLLAKGKQLSSDEFFWINYSLEQCVKFNDKEDDKVNIEMFGQLEDKTPEDEEKPKNTVKTNYKEVLSLLQKNLKVSFLDTPEKVLEWISKLTEQNILGYRDNFVNRIGDNISSNFLEIYSVWRAIQDKFQQLS